MSHRGGGLGVLENIIKCHMREGESLLSAKQCNQGVLSVPGIAGYK